MITAVSAAHGAAGAGDVVVTSGGKTATLANAFTFVAPGGTNAPPVVGSIRSVGSHAGQPSGFADIGESVTLVASVTDAETPADRLTYAWSGPGTFSGTGSSVTWQVPGDVSPTPSPVSVTLTVTESFVENNVTHHQSSSGSFVMQVHDSRRRSSTRARTS